MLKTAVTPTLVEHYVDMHALDFRRRRRLLTSLQHNLDDLYQWDLRLSNAMQALVLLTDNTQRYLEQQLLSPLSVGDVFTIALFSSQTHNSTLLEGCFALTQAMPHFIPAIEYLIEWQPLDSFIWQQLRDYPHFKALAVYLRPELSSQLALSDREIASLRDKSESLPALIAALFSQRHPHARNITQELLATESTATNINVLEVLLRQHGVHQTTQDRLIPLMHSAQPQTAQKAAWLFTLHSRLSPQAFREMMDPNSIDPRVCIQALGWSGFISHIPLLIDYLDSPRYARLSAAAITTITGSLPEKCGWQGNALAPPPLSLSEGATLPEDDPDSGLTWPDKAAFLDWWQQHAGQFNQEVACLNGAPTDEAGLISVLYRGSLQQRFLAAERLRQLNAPLTVNARAPAQQQLNALEQYSQQRNSAHV